MIFLSRPEDIPAVVPSGCKVFLVYDRNVSRLEPLLRDTCTGAMALDASEEGKTMDTVLEICRWLLSEGADRESLLIAAGGGITTDLCGFAASVYKRGIRFGFIPTTLLAQVDAAIGGKNGVNLDGYKNMIGVIREPEFTIVCPALLDTLPLREWRGGAAELLKTFIIDNTDGRYEEAVEMLSHHSKEPLSHSRDCPGNLIPAAARIKERIVSEDLYEKGLRRHLNLGHTFAHAMERLARLSGKDISHGEAVAMGIILAARVSERKGLAESGLEERLRADFKAAGLPVDCPFPPEELAEGMEKDKKAALDKVNFILIRAIGDVVTVPMSVPDVLDLL